LAAFLKAKQINQACGAQIAPWEVDEIPEEWLDAAEALMTDLPQMARGYQQIEDYKAKWRAEYKRKNG
jgi:hypothetical protein